MVTYWLKRFGLNLAALSLAAIVGVLAVTQADVLGFPISAEEGHYKRVLPFFRGFIVSAIVASIAPRTGFGPRFKVFVGIYLLDIALTVVSLATIIWLFVNVFDGDFRRLGLWNYLGALIPFITGTAGYYLLRRSSLRQPALIA